MQSCEFCSLSDESLFSDFFTEIVSIEEVDIPWDHDESRYRTSDEIEKEKYKTISHKRDIRLQILGTDFSNQKYE